MTRNNVYQLIALNKANLALAAAKRADYETLEDEVSAVLKAVDARDAAKKAARAAGATKYDLEVAELSYLDFDYKVFEFLNNL